MLFVAVGLEAFLVAESMILVTELDHAFGVTQKRVCAHFFPACWHPLWENLKCNKPAKPEQKTNKRYTEQPSVLWSDNGSQFKSMLNEVYRELDI